MRGASLASLVLGLGLGLSLAGCGGGVGGGDENAAVPLTKWLPPDAETYAAVDLDALREDLELEEDEDPLLVAPSAPFALASSEALGGLREFGLDSPGDVVFALDLGEATSFASSEGPGAALTAIATDADTGEIGSALGDIGFKDEDGVLVRRGDGTAFHLDIGLVFASEDEDLLRSIPEDPRDEVPDPLLEDLEEPFVLTEPPSDGGDCVRRQGAGSAADGSGFVAFLTEGDAKAGGIEPGSDFEFGEAKADGDVASVEVSTVGDEGGDPRLAPLDALREQAVEYAC